MATQRPLKEGSVRTYQEKVALGFPDILASEMDADLDTIYAAWNGGVATANLVDGSVTSAKLAPGAVGSGALGVDAVTRPAIANWAVGTNEIEDRAVTESKIAASAVGTLEIFPGAVVPDVRGGTVLASASIGTSATAILTFPGITTRGGSVLGLAVIGGQIIGRPSAVGTVLIQWVRDGSVSVLAYQVNIASGATAQAPTMPFPMSGFVDVPPAGNHTYEMRVWTSAADMAVQTQASPNQGSGFLMVFA